MFQSTAYITAVYCMYIVYIYYSPLCVWQRKASVGKTRSAGELGSTWVCQLICSLLKTSSFWLPVRRTVFMAIQTSLKDTAQTPEVVYFELNFRVVHL